VNAIQKDRFSRCPAPELFKNQSNPAGAHDFSAKAATGILADTEFIPLIRRTLPGRFGTNPLNQRQQQAILKPANAALQIVAGPGSGKTTVLVLRALKLVFVDGLLPESIVLTTFTRKAAKELRSRLIDWGLSVKHSLETAPPATAPTGLAAWLRTIDINRFPTGTLDGLCEELLRHGSRLLGPAPIPTLHSGGCVLRHPRTTRPEVLCGRIATGGP
jgi:hypothetical protein